MSDPATPAAPAGDKTAATPKGSPLGILLPVVALVAGIAAGTFVLGPKLAPKPVAAPAGNAGHGGHAAPLESKPKHGEEKATVYRIENVIVNPRGSEGSHFVMATVAVKCDDPKANEALRAHEDEVRDHVIGVLERQTLASLAVPGARDTLRNRLALALAPLTGSADPSRIYLPQFVIQ